MSNLIKKMFFLSLFVYTWNLNAGNLYFGINSLDNIKSKKPGVYKVQTGVFKSHANAIYQAKKLKTQYHYPVTINQSNNKKLFIVTVGPVKVGKSQTVVKQDKLNNKQSMSVSKSKFGKEVIKPSLSLTNNWTWVASVAGGIARANAGMTQTFYLSPNIEKTYAASKENNSLALGELFVGAQKQLSNELIGQLGLAVSLTGNADLQGMIWDEADPQFDNYSYNYKVKSTRIAAKTKLLLEKNLLINPWVSASVGIGFNRAHSFENTSVIFPALPNNNFTNNTKTAFSYTLGIGAQKSINEHWALGVGYEFSDWGKSQLNRAAGQNLNSGLELSHLYTNTVLFNLSVSS